MVVSKICAQFPIALTAVSPLLSLDLVERTGFAVSPLSCRSSSCCLSPLPPPLLHFRDPAPRWVDPTPRWVIYHLLLLPPLLLLPCATGVDCPVMNVPLTKLLLY